MPGRKPVTINADQERAVTAWNLMNGELIWTALNDISEYLEVQNAEEFIDALIILQEYQRTMQSE